MSCGAAIMRIGRSIFIKIKNVLTTFTLHVDTTAPVAEVPAAPAPHVIAALSLFDPDMAVRALFNLHSSHKALEQLLCFISAILHLSYLNVSLARHPSMVLDPAV